MFTYKRFINKYQIFFFPLGILSASILVGFMFLIPGIQRTIDQFQEVKERQEEVKALKDRLALLLTLDERELTDDMKLVTSAVPLDKSLPTILRTVEGLAGETQITVSSLALSNPGALATEAAKINSLEEKQFQASIVPFTVTLNGTLDQLSQFLERSRSVRRFIRARVFTIAFTDENELRTQVSFDSFFSPLQSRKGDTVLLPLTSKENDTLTKLKQFQDVGALVDGQNTPLPNDQKKENPFAL